MNEKCPTTFQRRPVHVCFLAETSNGLMIDFRRMRLVERAHTFHSFFQD